MGKGEYKNFESYYQSGKEDHEFWEGKNNKLVTKSFDDKTKKK